MCMQCSAGAKLVKENVLPGYSLYQSTKDTAEWPLGWFGLVRCNDPAFVFKGPLRQDPCEGLTEDDLDVMPEHPEGYDEFESVAQELSGVQFARPYQAYEFIAACLNSGYDPKVHGYEHGFWLANHLAKQIDEA